MIDNTWVPKVDNIKETKALIKQAIVDKGVPVNESDSFRSYASKILSIQGGGGSLPGYDGPVTVSPSTEKQILLTANKSVLDNITVNPVTSNIDANIQPDNIKFGVSILGVTGTFSGGGPITEKQCPRFICYDTWQEGFGSFSNRNILNQIKSIDWTDFNKLGVTNMYRMFGGWSGKTLDIANLSTTGVTDMDYMFNNCIKLTSLDLSHFDTSQVTGMRAMFDGCENLTSLDLSHFNTRNVTNMSDMFNGCRNLTSLDLSHFDTSQVTNMDDMISNCRNLTSITFGNNWASNRAIMKFDAHTGYSFSPSYSELPKESVMDLFNKLAVRDNNPVVNVEQKVYDALKTDEIAIATNKGWTVTRV